jgi:hypothetical protein
LEKKDGECVARYGAAVLREEESGALGKREGGDSHQKKKISR